MKRGMKMLFPVVLVVFVLVGSSFAQSETVAKIDINSATVSQLETLPGIGPAIAERIVKYREENGPFKTVEDLAKVNGIGAKKLERIIPLVGIGKGE